MLRLGRKPPIRRPGSARRRDSRFFAWEAAAPERLTRPALRLSVDTEEDLHFMRRLFSVAEAGRQRPVPLEHLIDAAARL